MKRKNKGFTLIELIVSVTIIAVLTIVGVISFSGTNKKARDSRRTADLENIRIALELYRQGTGSTYPADDQLNTLIPTYLKKMPQDPKGNIYTYTSDGYDYSICANVEDIGSTSEDISACTGEVVDGYVGFYMVTNP